MHDNGLRIVLPGEIDFSFFLYSFLFFFFVVAGEFGVCTSDHDMHLIRGKPMKTKRCIANCQMKSASPAATITHTAMVVLSPSEKWWAFSMFAQQWLMIQNTLNHVILFFHPSILWTTLLPRWTLGKSCANGQNGWEWESYDYKKKIIIMKEHDHKWWFWQKIYSYVVLNICSLHTIFNHIVWRKEKRKRNWMVPTVAKH